jgi:serine-type D-Ala-D-Ala carboxypeptidase/endopeptidase
VSANQLLRTPGTMPLNEEQAVEYYSNFAYGLAGVILERNRRQPLQKVFEHYIFNTRGVAGRWRMENATLNNIDNNPKAAFPHNQRNNASYWHFSGMAGAGGVKCDIIDMLNYARMQTNFIYSYPDFTYCQQPVVRIDGIDCFGLGWEYYYTGTNKRIIVKDGGTGGFTAFIAFSPPSERFVVALFNNGPDNNPGEPFVALLEEYFR